VSAPQLFLFFRPVLAIIGRGVPLKAATRDFASRFKKGTGAGLSASASVRLAGTFIFKRKYAPTSRPPRLRKPIPGRKVTEAPLESMGLVAPEPLRKRRLPPFDVLTTRPRRKAWPSYRRCLHGAPESTSGGKEAHARGFHILLHSH
jgi:hypothetical protein